MLFRLEVQQIHRSCLFRLAWDKGQQIAVTVSYPENLFQFYRNWQKAYFNFYKKGVRARVPKSSNNQGMIRIPHNWHRQLREAEAALLDVFHRWLRREELYEIRAKIASTANSGVFITCNPLELARLPWETWSIGAEFGSSMAIARSPLNIRANVKQNLVQRHRKPRVLAILGDDTGLNLQGDRDSLNSLQQIAELQIVTWEVNQPSAAIKERIKTALIDPKGWEILFFAGHSNETAITGGELAIAPGVAIAVKEIAPQLTIAKNKGLQFALFNSCSGLSIANSLIDLGLSQVVIMREPIHNRVAQVFLVQFLKALGEHQNVSEALITTSKYLKTQDAYPSAYLIPSLFCHPDAQLYKIAPWKWQQKLSRWLPNRTEAIVLSALCLVGLLPPLENFLIERRVFVQALYRDLTGQLSTVTKAPVALIHIDNKSLRKAEITRPVPMDRGYLASLIDAVTTKQGKIIGIDYLFDRPQPNKDPLLAQAVTDAVKEHQTWFIFGAFKQTRGQEIGVTPETGIGNGNWTMQGYTDGLPNYVSLLPESENCRETCPFSYLLALTQTIVQQTVTENVPQPRLDNQENLRQQVYDYIHQRDRHNPQVNFLRQTRLSSLTSFVQYFGQQWLRPIEDFSIPPDLVYDRLPAWQLLDREQSLATDHFQQQVVLIGSGGYAEAGLTLGSDVFPTPLAIAYWQIRRGLNREADKFTGSEFLAYMTHHFLQRRLVTPLPALWVILLVFFLAKSIKLTGKQHSLSPKWLLIFLSSATAIYGLLGLQLYISGAILLPWLLPAIALITFMTEHFLTKYNYSIEHHEKINSN